ncbi:hypothetical protein AZI85_00630 [Bdellovibrio bacteriovorus]|uniref:Uncharacterized protein n=1 Tax=Bdellovibrio bacteriovorus TaxID=959 RepID=A0A150WVP8_BDEBC|nr:DUF6624 domain-containing protein [Bdellovibrio bacteriovorus]KYG70486.1 hypothetical protein AZI85_00630 [Bdellovibrio bacteriovorus]
MNEKLKEELLHLIREDEATREVLASTGELFHGYHPAMEKVHLRNADKLKKLIEDNKGFPTIDQVGEDACVAALRIVLHAISLPDFMRAQEQVLVDLAKQNKVPKSYVAILVDRIRFYEGRKQIYATNADWDENGILRITEVEDPEQLNQRRHQMGLTPLESLVVTPQDGEYHPPDPAKRHQEFLEWTRKTGWRSLT